ncbi:MAG: HDOD domain-containing protein [Burkholderiales bacterium]|nr:HDOD domain-containing protein [Burkholderiales bacterium]
MPASRPSDSAAPRAAAVRWFGRMQLLRLLGKSERTMAWLVEDSRDGAERMLVLPRVQPGDAAALEHWMQVARRGARLNHPQIASALEVGAQDGWPYVTYEAAATVADRLPQRGLAGPEAAQWTAQLLQGLAFAHEAGVAHHDIQPYLLLVGEGGTVQLAGLGVAAEPATSTADPLSTIDGRIRELHRSAAERDVLAAGILLHRLLTGENPLEEPDIGRVIALMPPQGREFVRLSWNGTHPIAEPLRAIANRATDRQERQRYRSARTLLRALEGWLRIESEAGGGVLALLGDRLRSAGVLPASPGAAARAARLAMMTRERTNELAEVVLEDLALSFELLRLVNTAQVRGAQVSGTGPVLTVRRAIAMLGLDGVRRAALSLRPWPGPLTESGAAELERLIERCKRAARVAMALRPAGYDSEVVYLLALLQNLGRLVVQYHYADEAQQIRRLMQAAPNPREGEPEEPGMSEESAAYAVLGADIESIGIAVARYWGLDDSVLAMIRRHAPTAAVRAADSDDDLLQFAASCGNEAIDALAQPAARASAALHRVVQRYGRLLGFGMRELQAVLQGQSIAPIAYTAPAPLDGAAA